MVNDLVGKLVADKYRVGSLIREGEMGDLYSARNEILDKPVTMKILPPALAVDARWAKRFIDEARSASSISHENILALTDFGTDAKGISYSVFENSDGRTLRDLLSDESSIDEKDALAMTREMVAAVRAAHEKKIVHGSLDPANIFVEKDGDNNKIKVFGLGSDPQKVARNAEPQYLAPEQLTAFSTADERSDIYALGIMFYEMLSGVVPFDGATVADVAAKQGTEPPPPLSAFRRDLHPEIEPIVLTAIAAEPERRYQTVEAFAEDLEILASRVGVPTAAAAAAGSAASPGAKRNIWQTAFIALAGISLLAAALIYATSVDPTTLTTVDAASLPVQPIGPATGALEDNLAKQGALSNVEAQMIANSNAAVMDMLPGGDGYNAWANNLPPPGAPTQQLVPQGGQPVSGDPNSTSPFMSSPDVPRGGVQLYTKDPDGRCILIPSNEPIPCSVVEPKEKPLLNPPKTVPPTGANTKSPDSETKPKPSPSPNVPKKSETQPKTSE